MRATGLVRSLTLLLLLGAGPAFAQGEKARAMLLFDDATKMKEAQQYPAACPKFAESYRLDPQLGTLLHLADCYEKNGQTASAWAHWREGAELAEQKADPRADTARRHVADLEGKLSRLTIDASQASQIAGLEVRVDGQLLGQAVWGTATPMDPGEHTVEAKAPGHRPWNAKITVEPQKAETVAIPPLEAGSDSPPTPGASPATVDDASVDVNGGSGQRTIGYVVGGVGIVGLVVGTVFLLQRGSKLDERDAICPTGQNCTDDELARNDQLTDDARSAGTLATVGFIAGGAALAGGIVLVLTAPSGQAPSAAFSPFIGRDGLGLSAVGRF